MNGRGLRIAVFSDSAMPLVNGVSTSIATLTDDLRELGHSVTLFAPRYYEHADADPNTYRFASFETGFNRGYPCARWPYFGLLRHFRQGRFDLVHVHTPFFVGMVGLRWAESHAIPLVATYHTLYDRYAHYIPILPRRYVRFRLAKHTNFFYNSVSQVIVPSDAALRWLRRHAVTTPATVVPTGVPRPQMLTRTECREALGISPAARVLLYVGRLAPEKNLDTLLEACRLTMVADRSIRLVLVGDGPSRGEVTRRVRELGIGDAVTIVGAVPRHEVDRYYAAADLFVFASITETQGLVVQEAMSYGLPPVAMVGGGASETIRNGLDGLVSPNDPATFARLVRSLLDDESRRMAMAEVALESRARSGVRTMTESVLEVYRRAREGATEIAEPPLRILR